MSDWEGADHRSAVAHYALYVRPSDPSDEDGLVRMFRYAEHEHDPDGAVIEMTELGFTVLLMEAAKNSKRLQEMLGKALREAKAAERRS